jgi:hypothetical protein
VGRAALAFGLLLACGGTRRTPIYTGIACSPAVCFLSTEDAGCFWAPTRCCGDIADPDCGVVQLGATTPHLTPQVVPDAGMCTALEPIICFD